ncbi:MAG TPA: hypothetical protein VM531_11045 [Sphingomicrobium sp.]|jgi:hypothetical protein|nr:hypothetical protein [Sphingomicrobium sp.]
MSDIEKKPSDSVPATTTSEQDRSTAGQRRINILWELTQSFIAGLVVMAVLYVSSRMILSALPGEATMHQIANANLAFVFLTGVANLVIGFYFGRTNHQRTGGIGIRASGETR